MKNTDNNRLNKQSTHTSKSDGQFNEMDEKSQNIKKAKKIPFLSLISYCIFCFAIAWFFLPGFNAVLIGDFSIFKNDDSLTYDEPIIETIPQNTPLPTTVLENTAAVISPSPQPTQDLTPYITSNSYRSESVNIFIEKIYEKQITYYVAEIKIKNMDLIRTGIFKNTKGTHVKRPVTETAKQNNAILAVNTDYYTYRDSGIIIRNGKVIHDKPWSDILCIFEDGSMEGYYPDDYSAQELKGMGVKESFTFGPMMIKNGEILYSNLEGTVTGDAKHPRTGIGYYSPGHYLFVVVDGRKEGYSKGMDIHEFTEVFANRGCNLAYNLDGGGSSTMAFMGRLVNAPEGSKDSQRAVDGILFIADIFN